MPAAEPYRAWATFSFTAQSGRVNECDLLVAVPAGLFLVEIKSHPGELRNTGSTWNFRGDDRIRTINNPLHFNDLKSKELRSRLQWAARKLYQSDRMVPRIEPAVFLSAPDLVSHLDEAVRHAHSRSLYHRALAARSVYVSFRGEGAHPELRITDWQTAARDFDSNATFFRSIGGSALDAALIEDAAHVYLAPETDQPFPDPGDLDVFGLGAISYLILTGKPPAPQRSVLKERLRTESGLHLFAVADGISDALDALVFRATRADVNDRLSSAEEFLDLLDEAERAGVVPDSSVAPAVDPLEALPGQALDAEWSVRRVLGTGATARALLVQRAVEDDDGTIRIEERVFKVALDEQKADRLRAEERALKLVGGGAVVQLRGKGLREIGPRTVLQLEYAGEQSLGARLRGKGQLSYDELERFGEDLFLALDQLAANGVRHRDIKPDNLGIQRRKDFTWQLKLFDFSLTDASDRDVKAGTRGYLDPFLGSVRRTYFDDHAERYAAAVTLHEMASGERPLWGDGRIDPLTNESAELRLAGEVFHRPLQPGLTDFFQRALHRDIEHRFDTLRQMKDAWQKVFRDADTDRPPTTPSTVGSEAEDAEQARDRAALAADADTELELAGLSPRAVTVAAGLGATKVGQLLEIQPSVISKARGAGPLVRKELNRRRNQWAATLRGKAVGQPPYAEPPLQRRARLLRRGRFRRRASPASCRSTTWRIC